MVNLNLLPSEQEIMAIYNQFESINQVEAIPNDFMVKAVVVWVHNYYNTEMKARDVVEEIMERYDPHNQIFPLIFQMNYRQILVEIARQKLISNEDIFATIVA